jgi:ABC-2 type transport system ATP-binding protein
MGKNSLAIELRGATKMFGTSRGIESIDLTVTSGTIHGFLGPNGAGKTTTISAMVDLIRLNSGTALIFGQDSAKNGLDIRKRVGYLAGDMSFDDALTGMQLLRYFGSLRGQFDAQYVDELAKRLECDLSRKIKTLSRGNKQKVGLISALMHKPDLLLLDEPTSGLDPLIQEQFNEIILERKKEGKTTFISSHILSEVQELCDHVTFIREGKIIASKPISELSDAAPYQIHIVSSDKKLAEILHKLHEVHITEKSNTAYDFTYKGAISNLLNAIHPYAISDISITKGDLESTFMDFYKD